MRSNHTEPTTHRTDDWDRELASEIPRETPTMPRAAIRAETQDSEADVRARMSRAGSHGDGHGVPGNGDGVGLSTNGVPGTGVAVTGASSWQDIKGKFVDDPSGALASAEDLVRKQVEHKIRALNEEVEALCARDEETSTESLRTRLIRLQAFCERI